METPGSLRSPEAKHGWTPSGPPRPRRTHRGRGEGLVDKLTRRRVDEIRGPAASTVRTTVGGDTRTTAGHAVSVRATTRGDTRTTAGHAVSVRATIGGAPRMPAGHAVSVRATTRGDTRMPAGHDGPTGVEPCLAGGERSEPPDGEAPLPVPGPVGVQWRTGGNVLARTHDKQRI